MPPGQIIFLNGASSSGKTAIALALQQALSQPFLVLSLDGYLEWLLDPVLGSVAAKDPALPAREVVTALLPGVVAGFHDLIGGLARSGISLVVDHVLQEPAWLRACVAELAGLPVLFVGVHCPLAELERRERQRNREPGTARRQIGIVHAHQLYDVEVDTSQSSPEDCALTIQRALPPDIAGGAFVQLARRFA